MKVIPICEADTRELKVGDRISIDLDVDGHREFTATVQRVTSEGYTIMFDECVGGHRMNSEGTKKGGFSASDMKLWLRNELFYKFPENLQPRIKNLTLPTIGQIFGHHGHQCNDMFEPDTDEQFPHLKRCMHNMSCWWLSNATKENIPSPYFACVEVTHRKPTLSYDDARRANCIYPVFILLR